jgi:hypothetical protein
LQGPPSSVLTKWIRIIQHRWWRFYPAPLRALFFRAWQSCFKKITSCLAGRRAWQSCNVPCNGTIFNSEPACLFSYIVLYPWLFFNWIYFRWVRYSVRTIYITVFKVVITVGERYFMLGAATSMGTKPSSRGFWTGFYNLIPPLISACTCNISYTSTTYAYTIIV